MNSRIKLRITDVYIFLFVLNTIQSLAFPNSPIAGILRTTTLAMGVLAFLVQYSYNLDKIRIFLLFCGVILIVTCWGSVNTNDLCLILRTTSGRLTSIVTITLHLILFTVLNGMNLNTKKVKEILYLLAVGIIVSSLMAYSLTDIYNAVIQGKRLGADVSAINLFGMSATMMAIFLFYTMHDSRKNILVKVVGFITLAALTAASGSRTGILGLFIGLIVYVLLTSKNGKVMTVCKVLVGLLIVIYVMSLFNFTNEILERISTVWKRNDEVVAHSDDGRMQLILYGFQQWLKKPIFGYGFNTFTLFSNNAVSYNSYAHNNYIELLFNDGLVGACCYYIPRIITVSWLIKALKFDKTNNLVKLFIAEMVLLLLFDITIVSYYYISLQSIWILGAGYARHLNLKEVKKVAVCE